MNTSASTASPLHVTAPGGQTKVLVMDRKEGFPATFALMATTAAHRVAVRVSGGCKGMGPDDKRAMLAYFAEAFTGFRGFIWSGATRQLTKEGDLDPMVTDVPGVIAAANPECVALGSAPRTDVLRLVGESRLVLDGYGTGPNPSMSGILIVQNGADGKSDWDGDLDAAFGLMENLVSCGGFSGVGVIAWNGGPITEDEVMRSARKGWPTIVIKGSGRAADEIAAKLEAGDASLLDKLPKGHRLVVADRSDPDTLRDRLLEFGLIA
ncbi:MAG TPA: hypothetical protein VL500_05225 [Candidatus Eisenbacteria bacterium]|jgi:hypothetical protein|nr:hypothetical protein [Candidatus Eisenbacteria bacterium]